MAKDVLSFTDVRRCICGGNTKTIETRILYGTLYRRRECKTCGNTTRTIEMLADEMWQHIKSRNYRAMKIAATYLSREADRLKGITDDDNS